MAFIPIPNTVELVPRFKLLNGNIAVNVLHFEKTDGSQPTSGDLSNLVAAYLAWEGSTLSQRSAQVQLVSIYARDMTAQNSVVLDYAVNPVRAGALASNAMPSQVSIAMSLRTGLAGRSFRGRVYHIGLTEAQVAGDFLNAGVAAALLTKYAGLLATGFTSIGFELVVVSRFANGVPRAFGVTSAVKSIILVDERVDTQRRRLVGEGG